jgi:hypothetical protein
MKSGFLTSLILFIALSSHGQNSYYETPETINSGAIIIDGKGDKNFRICQVLEDGKVVRFSPYEVKGYRIKDGPEYFSREISVADTVYRVFLERLNEGKSFLYYYLNNGKVRFFWEKDGTELYPVPENESADENALADFLVMVTSDCPEMAEMAGLVKHNRIHLTKFINAYNECNPITFPKVRYGVLIGVSTKKMIPSHNNSDIYLDYFDFNSVPALSAGAYVNIPIVLSNVSLQVELLYNQYKFSYSATAEDIDFDFTGKLNALKIPVLIRYSRPADKFKAYFIAGPVLELNIRHDFTLYQTSEEVTVLPESDYSPYVKDLMKGFAAGCGAEYKLTGKISAFLELRYDFLSNFSAGSFLNNSGLSLMTGINF